MNTNMFYAPKTAEELTEFLKIKEANKNLYLAAGCTDLLVDIKKRGIKDFDIIDLTQLKELKEIEKKDKYIDIGAAATMTEIENSDIIKEYAYALAKAASMVGSTQIRNRGTIGGNIANASQSGDMITACSAFDPVVVLLNSAGVYREMPLGELITGIGRTKIEADEAIIKIRIPLESGSIYSSFSKVGSRKNVTISKINHSIKLTFAGDYIENASMYFGSIGTKPIKAVAMEKHSVGKHWDESLKDELLELGTLQVDEAIPGRASREYKRTAIKGVLSDAFDDIANQREAR